MMMIPRYFLVKPATLDKEALIIITERQLTPMNNRHAKYTLKLLTPAFLLALGLSWQTPVWAGSAHELKPQDVQTPETESRLNNTKRAETNDSHRKQWMVDLARFLKMKPETLHEKLKEQSLAEIASQQGIKREALKEKLVALMKEHTASHPSPLGKDMDYAAAAERIMDAKGGWHQGKRKFGRLADARELAALLKITPEQLHEELAAGKTLAQIAEKNKVSVQLVIDQQVKAVHKRLDRHLAEGKLTREQYEKRKALTTTFVTDFVYGRNIHRSKPSANHSISGTPADRQE